MREPVKMVDLDRYAFPLTIAVFSDGGEDVGTVHWCVTALAPTGPDAPYLEIPPVARWVGHRVKTAVMTPLTFLRLLEAGLET